MSNNSNNINNKSKFSELTVKNQFKVPGPGFYSLKN